MTMVHIRMPAELKTRAKAEARRLGLSLTDYVRLAVVERLEIPKG